MSADEVNGNGQAIEVYGGPSEGPAPSSGGADFHQWHLAMRGRYRRAFILAAILGLIGVAAGALVGKKTFMSSVTVHIAPTLPKMLYDDSERTLPRYEQFVETQTLLIQSRRVVDAAMRDPVWAALSKDLSDDATMQFMGALTVERHDELLVVRCQMPTAAQAIAGAQAVVNAYKKVQLEDDAASGQHRLDVLQQIEQAANQDILAKRQKINSIAAEAGSPDVAKLYDGKFQDVRALSQRILDLEAMAPSATTRPGATSQPTDASYWAQRDPELRDLLSDQKRKEDAMQVAQQRWGEANPAYQLAERELATAQSRVRERLVTVQEQFGNAPPPPLTPGAVDPSVIEARLKQAREQLAAAQADLVRYGKLNLDMAQAKSEMELSQSQLDVTRNRMEQLRIESYAGGRITVLGDADRPLGPWSDSRKKLGGLGGFAGAALGFGIVLARALMDDRVRHSKQAPEEGTNAVPVLGILPEVPEGAAERPEDTVNVTRSLHLIRATLQLAARGGRSQVVTVTGPLPGSGKTSVTLGLGTSFGRAGSRTLLLDFDLTGQGLSASLMAKARRRVGAMLVERGLVTEAQVKEGIEEATRRGCRIGEALVSLGFVGERALSEVIEEQRGSSAGVVDALMGEPVENCVSETVYENVWLMSAGDVQKSAVGAISPLAVSRLIDSLRSRYDAVLIDTGPMPGCVESSLAAVASDAVVVVISRGDPRAMLRRTLAALRQIGAPPAGIVFNRAEAEDFVAASASTSRSTSRQGQSGRRTLVVGGEG
jgi:Mrp family chromosome partitioning ATPase